MSQSSISIFLIGGEQRLQDGLRALVASLPQKPLLKIEKWGGEAILHAKEACPDLIILNADPPDITSLEIIKKIKLINGYTRCIILVDSIEEIGIALQTGADSAILRGFSSSEFFGVLNKMISEITQEPMATNRHSQT